MDLLITPDTSLTHMARSFDVSVVALYRDSEHFQYWKPLGLEEGAIRSQSSAGISSIGWEEVLDEAGDLRGFPVKTVMQIEMGGESCNAVSGQPIAMDDMWSNAANAAVDSAAQTAGYHAGQKVAQETAEAMGDSVGGSIAGSAVGAASGEVISGFLKRFRNRKQKTEPQPAPSDMANTSAGAQINPADGSVVLFRITSELTDINDHKIPLEQFEVPAGWKKVSAY